MTEETNGLSFLLSGSTLILLLIAFYVARALWIARRVWAQCSTDTKVLYLLVAPILTFAVDILEVTDRLFWSRQEGAPPKRVRPAQRQVGPLRARVALRPD